MKKTVFLSLSLLLSSASYANTESDTTRGGKHVILQSEVLHLFDGTAIGVNADTLELIGLIRREINNILIGKKTKDGTRIGLYEFDGKKYSLEQLVEIEQQTSLTPDQLKELDQAFKAAREDVKSNFRPFMDSARNTKHQMIKLVEESCRKRDNMESFLLNWAEQKAGHEEEGFDRDITDTEKLNSFCVDLLNFLGDLVRSCPKAQKLFIDRVRKCKKISQMLPTILKNIKNNKKIMQKAFMHYLKEHHVDRMEMKEINNNKLQELLKEFIHNHY